MAGTLMSSPTVVPPAPDTLQVPNDPVMDQLYGTPAVEPRTGKPPISRSYQFTDDFAPPAPPSLETAPAPITAPPAPVPAPTPAPPVQTAPEAPIAPPVEAPKEFTATVDLGDGSGPQVFKADTQQGVIDKLVDAQKHATIRIRQLKEKAKAKPDNSPAPEPLAFQPRTLSEQEIADINEKFKTNPYEAWRMVYEASTGTKPDAVARAVYETQTFEQQKALQLAETEFISDHVEDYDCSPESGTKMYAFLAGCTRPITDGGYQCKRCGKIHDAPMRGTRANLEYAFETLTEQGAVFMKKAPEPPAQPAPAPVVAPPPAPPVPVVVAPPAPVPQVPALPVQTAPPPPVMLSDRSGQRPPQPEAEGGVDVTGWQNLPLHEMKARIAQTLKRGSTSGR